MSDVRSFPKWKRFLFVFTAFVSLICLNFSFFAVNSSANVAAGTPSHVEAYSFGLPFDLTFSVDSGSGYSGVFRSPNRFVYSDYGVPLFDMNFGWSSSSLTDFCSVSVSSPGRVVYSFTPFFAPAFIEIPSAFFLPLSEISVYNSYLSFSDPVDDSAQSLSSLRVNYLFDYAVFLNNTVRLASQNFVVDYPVSDNSVSVPLIPNGFVSYLTNYLTFEDSSGDEFVFITGYNVSFDDFQVHSFDISGVSSDVYTFDRGLQSDVFSFVSTGSLRPSFDDISWTSWLVNSVGAFMNFEIVPNLSISGIFALLLGMSLFMVFLKIFAGG